jgi:serine/threonine protein kinase/Tol biopolymer transport system component
VGPYEVTALLGEGGMGRVWRARHLLLKRDDALKVLPERFLADPTRLARFRREAEVLASLNHPNIAQVHGLEGDGYSSALVMELVEGPTLEDRLAHGPLPVAEALSIGEQIADALEAANEQSIVHRDLKPSNIKVRPDGTVKLLDFGLARWIHGATPGDGAPSTKTLTLAGSVVGTPAYMSPEQASGEAGDARSDVWAFGCVLYEMLAGRRAFDGATRSEVFAAVLSGSPDWSRLPADVPSAVRVLLRRCLTRDLRQRPTHMSAVRLVLQEQEALSAGGTIAVRRSSRARVVTAIVVLAIAALIALGPWLQREAPPPVVRTTIPADLFLAGTDRSFALTPDGSRLAYIGGDSTQILVRAMDGLDAGPILTTTAYLRGLFPSPDGRWLGFVENNFTLRKVSTTGGPAVTIVQMNGPSRGAAWGPDDTIAFATFSSTTGLQEVSANGGAVTVLTRPDRARGEAEHLHPAWLPGGRALVFTIHSTSGDLDTARIAVLERKTGTWRTILEGGYGARYVDSGHIVYGAAGALWAVPFDLSRHETEGAAVQVLPRIPTQRWGTGQFDVAANGTLVYPGEARRDSDPHVPVWVDRSGRETPLPAPPDQYRHPRLSPDGRRLALVTAGDIYVWEIDQPWTSASRMTFTPEIDWHPVWTPDGQRIVFGSWRGGGFSNLYLQDPNDARAERLTDSADMQVPTSITPDGSTVVFHSFTERIEALRLDGPQSARQLVLVETPQEERNGAVSPDGRWLAYEAEAPGPPGQLDVYVRPFPDVDRGLWQVTTGGGEYPVWARDGRELFYVKPDGTVVALPVEALGAAWRAGSPADVFRGPYLFRGDGSLGRNYDVAPDGQRFLMLKNTSEVRAPHFVVVQNWTAELTALTGGR